MSDLLELSRQYRQSGLACRVRLRELKNRRGGGNCSFLEELEISRSITMLTAMSRDCIAISNYLRDYYERRQRHDGTGEDA